MKLQCITLLLSLLLMVLVFFIMPTESGAALWIGGQAGVNFVAEGDVKFNPSLNHIDRLKNVKTNPAFIGGIIIGYDFVKEGFLGYDWPSWMKYFSVAVDITYNDFTQPEQSVQTEQSPRKTTPGPFIHIDKAHGYILELSLLFMLKYGFFPNPELPFGRLIPYVGVGPGLIFSVVNTSYSPLFSRYPSSDSLEPGVFTEAGIRYMVRRNVSVDAAFRYRYVYPSYDRNYNSSIGPFIGIGRIIAQSFDAIFRVNYHF